MTELRGRLDKLRALERDPGATDHERKLAGTVAARLQKRLDAMSAKKDPVWDSHGLVRFARSNIPDDIRSTDKLPFDSPWPEAWKGPRDRIDFEAAQSGHEFVLGWDCPRCTKFVSKAVPLWYIYRLVGSKVEPLDAIRGMMDGRHNQLCAECTAALGTAS